MRLVKSTGQRGWGVGPNSMRGWISHIPQFVFKIFINPGNNQWSQSHESIMQAFESCRINKCLRTRPNARCRSSNGYLRRKSKGNRWSLGNKMTIKSMPPPEGLSFRLKKRWIGGLNRNQWKQILSSDVPTPWSLGRWGPDLILVAGSVGKREGESMSVCPKENKHQRISNDDWRERFRVVLASRLKMLY